MTPYEIPHAIEWLAIGAGANVAIIATMIQCRFWKALRSQLAMMAIMVVTYLLFLPLSR